MAGAGAWPAQGRGLGLGGAGAWPRRGGSPALGGAGPSREPPLARNVSNGVHSFARSVRLRVGLLALLALASAMPLAAGQGTSETCQPPSLAFPTARAVYAPGDTYNLPFAIENRNGAELRVNATVQVTTPDGWTATPARRFFTIAPETVVHSVLAITAPSRGTGAPAGNITLSVTFTCQTGIVLLTSTPAEHVLGVRIRAFDAPWPLLLGGFALLALGVAIMGVRRLRRSILLSPAERNRGIEPGKSVKFTFSVHNRRGKPASYAVLVGGLPEGWTIHLALNEVDLEPGEEKTLWAIVRAPPTAPVGTQAPFAIRLQGLRGPRDAATAHLVAHVEAPPERPLQ